MKLGLVRGRGLNDEERGELDARWAGHLAALDEGAADTASDELRRFCAILLGLLPPVGSG